MVVVSSIKNLTGAVFFCSLFFFSLSSGSEFDKVKVQDSIPHGAVYRGISASADALIWGEVAMRGRADTPIYMSGHGTVYRLYRRIGARLFM